jgi:hypothetical protein
MRLQKYLTEEYAYGKFLKSVQIECKPYLNDIKKYNITPFFRGIQNLNVYGDTFGSKEIRQDRKPKGMDTIKFRILNTWLEENGHVRRDRAVIASSSASHASIFGEVCVIFPTGDYSYTWIKGKDMNQFYSDSENYKALQCLYYLTMTKEELNDFFWHMEGDWNIREKLIKMYGENIVNNYKSIVKQIFTTNKQMDVAYDNMYEIWFGGTTKYYYMPVKNDYYDALHRGIKWQE